METMCVLAPLPQHHRSPKFHTPAEVKHAIKDRAGLIKVVLAHLCCITRLVIGRDAREKLHILLAVENMQLARECLARTLAKQAVGMAGQMA